MNGKRSREAVLEFQDYQSNKGLLAKGTAGARKAALGKVLGILSPEEAEDVTDVDLDDLMMRFSNLQGKDYTPGSLNTYKSRIKSALDDFRAYLDNPLAFRPNVNRRERTAKPARATKSAEETQSAAPLQVNASQPEPQRQANTSFGASADILPIPLRPDLTIRIHGLPFDMTEAEAKKIANVVLAMASIQ